jgi:flagellar biosynthesis/type III secretory pathway M-ring protein FliF/YscJ
LRSASTSARNLKLVEIRKFAEKRPEHLAALLRNWVKS